MFSILAYVVFGLFLLAAVGMVYGGIKARRPAKPPKFGRQQNVAVPPVDPQKAKLGTMSMWAGFALFGLTLPMCGGCMVFDAYVNFINPDFYVQRKMQQDEQRELREAGEAAEEQRYLAEAALEMASTLKNMPDQQPTQRRVSTNASINEQSESPTMAAAPVVAKKQSAGSGSDFASQERRRQREYDREMAEGMAASEAMEQEEGERMEREEKRQEKARGREMASQMASEQKQQQMESEKSEADERRKRNEAGMAQERAEQEAAKKGAQMEREEQMRREREGAMQGNR